MFSHRVDEEIVLILPTERNAEEIYKLVRENLEQLTLWMPWATDEYSLDSAKQFLRQNLLDLAENRGFGASILLRDKIVGQIGFHNFDLTNKSTQMGYWLAREAQGKGVMTKCSRVFVDYAFDDLSFNRVQINCNVENTKSRAIPERLGFQLEGIHRQVEFFNNRFGDWAIYAMLKEDWKK